MLLLCLLSVGFLLAPRPESQLHSSPLDGLQLPISCSGLLHQEPGDLQRGFSAGNISSPQSQTAPSGFQLVHTTPAATRASFWVDAAV